MLLGELNVVRLASDGRTRASAAEMFERDLRRVAVAIFRELKQLAELPALEDRLASCSPPLASLRGR